jgi:hypothetical protein
VWCLLSRSLSWQVEDNAQVFTSHAPGSFLARLHELMHCPRFGPDSLSGEPHPDNPGGGSQDADHFDDVADYEVRDMALDIIAQLGSFPEIRRRLVTLPHLLGSLVLLLDTKQVGRAGGPWTAARLIAALVTDEDGRKALEPFKAFLIELAFRQEPAAGLVCALYLLSSNEDERGVVLMDEFEEGM